MSATGLSTAEIVINVNKNKSHSGSQNKTAPCRILHLDCMQKKRAREGHLPGALVPLRTQEGEGPSLHVGCSGWQAGWDPSMYLFSAPRDLPWMVIASLQEVCTWRGGDGFRLGLCEDRMLGIWFCFPSVTWALVEKTTSSLQGSSSEGHVFRRKLVYQRSRREDGETAVVPASPGDLCTRFVWKSVLLFILSPFTPFFSFSFSLHV